MVHEVQRGTAWRGCSRDERFEDLAALARVQIPARATLWFVVCALLGSPAFAQETADIPIGDRERRLDNSGVASGSRVFHAGYATPIPLSLHDGLLAAIRPHGVDLFPLAGTSQMELGDATFGLTLEELRRGACMTAVGPAAISHGDEIAAFVHEAFIESYIQGDNDLEQVFTFHEAPLGAEAGTNHEPLELHFALCGGLRLDIHSDRRNATLLDASGNPLFSYSGLKAWDADGKWLEAHLRDDCNQLSIIVNDIGARYPIVVDPLIGYLRARLVPADISSQCYFGSGMALDGETLAVGSSGAVYVYRRSTGGIWAREAKLVSSYSSVDGFGAYAVAISGDTLATGAPGADDFGQGSGSAFVFTRSGNKWTEQARVLASDGGAFDYFGSSVAVQQDRLVVGAIEDDDSAQNAGAAYVFQRNGVMWSQTTKLLSSNGQNWERFGASVDVDGDMIVAGAPSRNYPLGEAFVFRYAGNAWTQEAILTSPNPRGFFGYSVATLNGRIVCGEPGYSSVTGSAQVFRRVGVNWILEWTLLPHDPAAFAHFGIAVDIFNDRALIGSWQAWPLGAAYLFTNSVGSWNETVKLVPFTTSTTGTFGTSVALGPTEVCVGDNFDSQAAIQAGAAYIFDVIDAHSVYCTAKTNSLGCSPTIAAQGAGSASEPQGMVISCSQVLNNKPGLLLYSISGRSSAPFQGGILCVSQAAHRTPGLSSGGASAPVQDCSGAYSIDMNSFARGALGGQPIQALGVPGTLVQCQWWGRDPAFAPPANSMLSDAVEYTIVQ